MNSVNGTNSFTAKEILNIIRAARKSGVSHLKIGDMDVEFEGALELTKKVSPLQADDPRLEKEALAEADLELREQKIQDLLLTDPLEAERLMSEHLLEGGATDGPDDEEA
jgi:hypothetical protein